MAPLKLFISYRSLDSARVDPLVARLQSIKNTNGSPCFDVWQDKFGIPAEWREQFFGAATGAERQTHESARVLRV